jgi:outer membrane receptor protein involved in Fe transport
MPRGTGVPPVGLSNRSKPAFFSVVWLRLRFACSLGLALPALRTFAQADSDSPNASPSAASPATSTPAATPSAGEVGEVDVVTSPYHSPYGPPPLIGYRPGPPKWGSLGSLQFGILGALVVTASRTPQPPANVAATVRTLGEEALRSTPALTLDDALHAVPGFSLFRRSDSLTANPTAQGVSLRGLGPSGASRSLVLLDGVPLNDPFGGWVAWTKLPYEGLAGAEVVSGGGSTAWGNAALGGVIQLFSEPLRTEAIMVDNPTAPGGVSLGSKGVLHFNASAGDFSTRSFEFGVTTPVGDGIIQIEGRDFSTDGFSLVAPERRGPIDVAAWSRHRWLSVRWKHELGENLEVTATARGYEEFRGNGTPYQRNGSREKFASVEVAGQPSENFAWNAVAYGQDQGFAATFSSVNATRTAETPASDQFGVPAISGGLAWTGAWKQANGARTGAGVDARFVSGETRENYTFSNGVFTRQRVAGGDQTVAGIFALHDRPLAADWRGNIGVRLDDWEDSDGHRRETDRASGTLLRDDHYDNRDGAEFSPSAGLVWTPLKAWRFRASAQQAFRRPTLNELYRPFRQGSNVTEANPDLSTEHVTTGELGADWTHGPFSTVTSVFWDELHDAVGNVTLARGPGTFPLFGTLPVGGVGLERLNLDRTRVRGLEFSAKWRANRSLDVTAGYLYDDTAVISASVAPTLVGKRLAQVPKQTATLGATWHAPAGVKVTPRVRWIGRQFEDDQNTLILGEVVVVDITASRALTKHLELYLTVENLGNARVETGRSVDGVVNTGTPRLALGGIRGTW